MLRWFGWVPPPPPQAAQSIVTIRLCSTTTTSCSVHCHHSVVFHRHHKLVSPLSPFGCVLPPPRAGKSIVTIRLCSTTTTSCSIHCQHSSTSTMKKTPGNCKPSYFGSHRRGYQQQHRLHYKKHFFGCFLIYLTNLTKWMSHTERTDWRNMGNEWWGRRVKE
jgi:hypothetical protein